MSKNNNNQYDLKIGDIVTIVEDLIYNDHTVLEVGQDMEIIFISEDEQFVNVECNSKVYINLKMEDLILFDVFLEVLAELDEEERVAEEKKKKRKKKLK